MGSTRVSIRGHNEHEFEASSVGERAQHRLLDHVLAPHGLVPVSMPRRHHGLSPPAHSLFNTILKHERRNRARVCVHSGGVLVVARDDDALALCLGGALAPVAALDASTAHHCRTSLQVRVLRLLSGQVAFHAGLVVDDARDAGGAAKALAVQQHARLDLSLLDALSGHRLWIDLVQLLQRSCAACCNTFSVTGLAATLAGHDVGCWAGVFEIEGAALLLLS